MNTELLTEREIAVLRAAMDRVIPPDDFPGAWQAGAGDYLLRQLQPGGDLAHLLPTYRAALDALDAEATALHGAGFAELDAARQDALLARLEAGAAAGGWPLPPAHFVGLLVNHTAEGFYSDPGNGGNREGASWRMVGFEDCGLRIASEEAPPAPQFWGEPRIADDYDAVIVGAGAAGGIVAMVLAEAGKRVLLLERGRYLRPAEVPRDHLRNHRLALYGHNLGPELGGNPRVLVESDGTERVLRPHEGGWHNNAMAVGGGTVVYGAQAWRFLPADFRMASTYGVPEGSSLADWPIGYDDLEPYYDRAEWEIGVSGDGDANRFQGPRRRGYPMPPVPVNPARKVLEAGARALGWNTFPAPLLINTAPYGGRPACVRCNTCVGFACPSDSKNGTHNTAVPRALATGLCTLVTQAMAERIETDARGDITGVSFLVEGEGGIRRHTVRAKAVVASAGAIESARLLLNSASAMHPSGLGNAHDLVGRNLQGHTYPVAFGLMPEPVLDDLGPGVSLATCQFSHGNPGIIGGAMLANDFIETPIYFWKQPLPPDVPRWGEANKRWMREAYSRWLQVKGPVQEISSPDARVALDAAVRDRYGLPVARLSGATHPETLRVAEFMRERAEEWLRASGAERVWSRPAQRRLSADQHQAGTCRMGCDPRASVTDPWGRVHGHDNLFVVDASLHVTNGGFNPALTIMALAFRCAEHIAEQV